MPPSLHEYTLVHFARSFYIELIQQILKIQYNFSIFNKDIWIPESSE